jgi:hypothetical protein
LKVFISSASKDHLNTKNVCASLNEKNIKTWSSVVDKIGSGDSFEEIIFSEIEKSIGSVVLVSQALLDSTFVTEKELGKILSMKSSNPNYFIIYLILEQDIDFRNFVDIDINKIQYLNTNSTALKIMPMAHHDLIIRELVDEVQEKLDQADRGKKAFYQKKGISPEKFGEILNEADSHNFQLSYFKSWLAKEYNDKSKVRNNKKNEFKETLNEAKDLSNLVEKQIKELKNLINKQNLDEEQFKKIESALHESEKSINDFLSRKDKWECTTKVPYTSKASASEKNEVLKNNYGVKSSIYKCESCNAYHLSKN